MENTLDKAFKNIFQTSKLNIWTIGNTGARNPLRLPDIFSVYIDSSAYGRLQGNKVNQARLTYDLSKKGLATYSSSVDTSAIIARKFRFVFERFGFIYPEISRRHYDFKEKDLGKPDTITPLGKTFLHAKTLSSQQECYLRGLITPLDKFRATAYYSQLLWTINILLALKKKTNSFVLNQIEFATCVQTTNPNYEVEKVVDLILLIRKLRQDATNKKKFDKEVKTAASKYYSHKINNFDDYGDLNIRYLVCTGILKRSGRGITIVPEYEGIIKELAKKLISTKTTLERFKEHCNGAELPQDNLKVAVKLMHSYRDALKSNNVKYSIPALSLDSVKNVNTITAQLKSSLDKFNEDRYALAQRNEWFEIYNYMLCLIKNNGHKRIINDDKTIQVPKSEAASYLEWTMWRAFLAIDHTINRPYESRGFKIDQNYLPVGTAPGNEPDLFFEFKRFAIVIEVTMSTNSRQEAMEGEPVRRHVADYVQRFLQKKPVVGIFIANKIDSNTAETFRIGVWYAKNDQRLILKIVPWTLSQFAEYFRHIFKDNIATPDQIMKLFKKCLNAKKDKYAPEWKQAISTIVKKESKV